ncbi:MAG: class I SAM-dependent methyltransferase [Rhizomicrobium sp.]
MRSPEEWNNTYLTGWHRKRWSHQYPSPELSGFLASGVVRPCSDILEVGCGAGLDAVFLAKLGHNVAGIDISTSALDIARSVAARYGATVSWEVGDVLELPFGDRHFDFVSDRGCFHHLLDSARPAYFRSIARVLRPGGFLFLRGRARPQPPLNPVSRETIKAHLEKDMFAIRTITPLRLVTDAGGMDAVAVLLQRN